MNNLMMEKLQEITKQNNLLLNDTINLKYNLYKLNTEFIKMKDEFVKIKDEQSKTNTKNNLILNELNNTISNLKQNKSYIDENQIKELKKEKIELNDNIKYKIYIKSIKL